MRDTTAAPAAPGHADQLVREWALSQFRENARKRLECRAATTPELKALAHLLSCPETAAAEASHGWECECISDVTRGDSWEIHITVRCPHLAQPVEWRWSNYQENTSLPEIINELIELDKANSPCWYEDDDD